MAHYQRLTEGFQSRFNTVFDWVYERYEKFLIIPFLIFVFAVGTIGYSYTQDGEFVSKGMDFEGGAEIQVQVTDDTTTDQIQQLFSQDYPDVNVRLLGQEWMLIETTDTNVTRDEVESILSTNNIGYTGNPSINTQGGAVGEGFLREAQIGVIIAFLIMSSVVFIAFRLVVPSLAVIGSIVLNMLFAIAGMNILGIDLTLSSLAALLMLIGYSVDTDIILSTRVLREQSRELKVRVKDSITTGATMTIAAIVAFSILFVVSTSQTMNQLAAVILLGLVADLPATWTGNAIIMKMYDEGRFS